MFIPNGLRVGSRIKLKRDVEVMAGKFTMGHELTVTGLLVRGWSFEDDEGNKLTETALLSDFYELLKY